MAKEKSCGMIIFTRIEEQIRYVIIQNSNGSYGFPKGHVEPGEGEAETAMREVAEEVRLRPKILPGFRQTDEYMLPDKPDTTKEVVYFLGTYSDQEVAYQQDELQGAWLLPFDKALSLLQFDRIREIFRRADDFVRKLVFPA